MDKKQHPPKVSVGEPQGKAVYVRKANTTPSVKAEAFKVGTKNKKS